MASGVMAGLWSLRLRSLHADFWAGERVMTEREPAWLEVGAQLSSPSKLTGTKFYQHTYKKGWHINGTVKTGCRRGNYETRIDTNQL